MLPVFISSNKLSRYQAFPKSLSKSSQPKDLILHHVQHNHMPRLMAHDRALQSSPHHRLLRRDSATPKHRDEPVIVATPAKHPFTVL